jgi:hypothetical protein
MSHGPLGNGNMWVTPGSPFFDAAAAAFAQDVAERQARRFRAQSYCWYAWRMASNPALGVESPKGEA